MFKYIKDLPHVCLVILLNFVSLETGFSNSCQRVKVVAQNRIAEVNQWFQKNKPEDSRSLKEALLTFHSLLTLDDLKLKALIADVCYLSVKFNKSEVTREMFGLRTCSQTITTLWPTLISQFIHETGWFLSKLSDSFNFAGLNYYSLSSRLYVDKLPGFKFVPMPWIDNGHKRQVAKFQTLEDGLKGVLSFYLFPKKKSKDDLEGELLYSSCFRDFSASIVTKDETKNTKGDKSILDDSDYESSYELKEEFLNCIGHRWAEAGTSGNYGSKAVGKDFSTLRLLDKYRKECGI